MSKIYGWIRRDGRDREVVAGGEEEITIRVNVGSKDDSREIINILVKDVGDAFVASVEGEEFRRMPKARWEE